MNKLTLILNPKDVQVLASVLGLILTGTDVSELKNQRREDYLLFSCVHDFFNKLDAKSKEIMAFGVAPGKDIRISIKRYEALALFFLTEEVDPETSHLPAVPDSTMMLIRTIRGDIHKQFLV